MLRMADRMDEDDGDVAFAPDSSSASLIGAKSAQMGRNAVVASRYGDRRQISLPTVIAVILVHALLIGALLQARHHYVRYKQEKLSVVNLTPPPPPPAEETPPPPAQPEVVAPPPIVQTPVTPRPQVITTPDPVPVIMPAAIAAPPAPPSAAPTFSAPPSTVQGGDLSAQMVSGKPPRYPIDSRRKREQGTVVLSLVVGLDGRVSTISVARSSGFPRLDDAARDAVRGWRWSPIIRDGQPVMVKGIVEIPFVIQSSD
jgi:protein TonB